MTLEGKIAVANMLLIAAVFLVFHANYTNYEYLMGKLPFTTTGVLALAALTFPVGWAG